MYRLSMIHVPTEHDSCGTWFRIWFRILSFEWILRDWSLTSLRWAEMPLYKGIEASEVGQFNLTWTSLEPHFWRRKEKGPRNEDEVRVKWGWSEVKITNLTCSKPFVERLSERFSEVKPYCFEKKVWMSRWKEKSGGRRKWSHSPTPWFPDITDDTDIYILSDNPWNPWNPCDLS